MKKQLHVFLILLGITTYSNAQNVGINATNSIPDASAMLDVSSTNKGLLIPRVALTGTTDVATITTATTSLLVYNIATATDVTPGYYYWDGATWLRMLEGGTNDFWKTTGNTGTTVGTNFLGTTDAQDFAIYTNNTEAFRVKSNGDIGIGTTTPSAKLEVIGKGYFNNPIINDFGLLTINGTGNGVWYSVLNLASGNNNGVFGIQHKTDNKLHISHNPGGGSIVLETTGNVGIGTTTPGAKLDVAGQVKITGGTPGAGKVLTSDATGLATWEQPLSSWFGVLEGGALPAQTTLAEIPVNFTIGYKIPTTGGGVVSTVGNSITVPTTGVYRVLVSGWSIGVTTPYLLMWNLKRNGITVYNPHFMNYTSGAGNDTSYEKFLSFNAGDIITLDLNHTSGTLANQCAGMQLVVELIK